jgi:outer membrane protein OmpA-like peptidoglycan-associated protein
MHDKNATSETLIEALTPKPTYKLRGIRFNQTGAANAEQASADGSAPSIAMGINFAFDSASLTQEAMTQLKPLGEALNSEQLEAFSFKIDGHTDAAGTENYNMELSKQRAIAVGKYLYAQYGVNLGRLVVTGKGESELYDSDNPRGAINRRVEISTIVKLDE